MDTDDLFNHLRLESHEAAANEEARVREEEIRKLISIFAAVLIIGSNEVFERFRPASVQEDDNHHN